MLPLWRNPQEVPDIDHPFGVSMPSYDLSWLVGSYLGEEMGPKTSDQLNRGPRRSTHQMNQDTLASYEEIQEEGTGK